MDDPAPSVFLANKDPWRLPIRIDGDTLLAHPEGHRRVRVLKIISPQVMRTLYSWSNGCRRSAGVLPEGDVLILENCPCGAAVAAQTITDREESAERKKGRREANTDKKRGATEENTEKKKAEVAGTKSTNQIV